MGLFDSFRDAMRTEDSSDPSNDDEETPGPKHLDEEARPEPAGDPSELEHPSGGKHARRD